MSEDTAHQLFSTQPCGGAWVYVAPPEPPAGAGPKPWDTAPAVVYDEWDRSQRRYRLHFWIALISVCVGAAIVLVSPTLCKKGLPTMHTIECGDVIEAFYPILFIIPIAFTFLLELSTAKDLPKWSFALFVFSVCIASFGQGAHLVGNSIRHQRPEKTGAHCDSEIMDLLYFYDEMFSHYYQYFGFILIWCSLFARELVRPWFDAPYHQTQRNKRRAEEAANKAEREARKASDAAAKASATSQGSAPTAVVVELAPLPAAQSPGEVTEQHEQPQHPPSEHKPEGAPAPAEGQKQEQEEMDEQQRQQLEDARIRYETDHLWRFGKVEHRGGSMFIACVAVVISAVMSNIAIAGHTYPLQFAFMPFALFIPFLVYKKLVAHRPFATLMILTSIFSFVFLAQYGVRYQGFPEGNLWGKE